MKLIEKLTLDEERALYGIRDTLVRSCTFDGPADGESALKECRDIRVEDCVFHLRYPFWHVEGAKVSGIAMTEGCRAAFWYDREVHVMGSRLGGIKAFREMDNCSLTDCEINSKEFGWRCRDLTVRNCKLESEYPFFWCKGMDIDGLEMKGKYSFQYCEELVIRNSNLDTKDAFWHAKNVTVYDSVIKGEYLAWYSENLRLVRCTIIGTQPLCYCKGLVLEDCKMIGCDLAFENSQVQASISGSVDSVKNPAGGFVEADAIGEIILDEFQWNPGQTKIGVRIST
ncbi:MAG: DUF3737 family protein [Oscillospiraceae bacterium]|nr:DUF3737 family protein [Oscillospiraceae bacterium]